MRLHRQRKRVRRGLAALEVVLITALTLPMAALILWLMVWTIRRFFGMFGVGVGMPYL